MRYQHWDELEQAVERLVAADGPNTDDLPADEFFALWTRFEANRHRVVEVEGGNRKPKFMV